MTNSAFDDLYDLEFTHPVTAEVYGPLRPCEPCSVTKRGGSWSFAAADSCGNYFALAPDGRVGFWDHETDEITELAKDVAEFAASCAVPEEVELDPSQVKDVWIDPGFASEHGIAVDDDGRPEA